MKVIVSLLHHFRKTPDGIVYPYSVFDYPFWQRYLEVFDEVKVFARVESVERMEGDKVPAQSSGPGVTFCELPEFLGARQYLKKYFKIKAFARQVLSGQDAVVLRVPGYMSTMLWKMLRREGRPYAVEVVGDPWQALAPGAHQSVLRPFLRRQFCRQLKKECQYATVAAYVTKQELQKRYPPGGWTTHYSSIELPADFIISETQVQERLVRLEHKAHTKGPWRLCLVGSLWHLMKSPDVAIDAVALCVQQGYDINLTIVGDGSLRGQLEQQASQLGLKRRIEFTGQLPPGRAINDQLDRADVFILPSRSEGLPRSIIEAFARGLPCIGGYEGGFPELLEEKYLVRPVNKETLAKTIMRVIDDQEGMKLAVRRNITKAGEYESAVLQKRRVELYTRLKQETERYFSR